LELGIFCGAPIVLGVVHGKARGESAVGAHNDPILAGAAAPVFAFTAHKTFHVLQARNGVDHFPTLALLVDETVEKIVDHGEIFRADVGVVLVEMLEVSLLHHGGFVDVESDGDTVVVGELGELLYVFDVGAADVGIEKHGVAVAILAADEIVEIFFDVFEGFGQPGLFVDGVDGEVDGGDAGVKRDGR
jgi:hypothetical protein